MIYLDSAATTMQKPKEIACAVTAAMGQMASSGRGDSSASSTAADLMFRARETAAELFDVADPERVVFTFNATHGLNIAIKSLVKSDMTVLISGYEHNAVTRPLASIAGIHVRILNTKLFDAQMFLEQCERELDAGVDLCVCTCISNVFGFRLPFEALAKLCATRNVPLILDASQAAGILPIHLERSRAAFIAMPGHKGLYGPQGTGLLLCGAAAQPLLYGGTGSMSALQDMPDFLPDRLEVGTHNLPGIAGLLEGMQFVKQKGLAKILEHEQKLCHLATQELSRIPAISCFCAEDLSAQTGVLSFRAEGYGCEEIGAYLAKHQIAVRSGLHCAPLAHQSAGSADTGTVRISFSVFNTERELRHFIARMRSFFSM